jgi:hypothetical protein
MYHQATRVSDELRDPLTVRLGVEYDADPAPASHVRGPEVTRGIELHERLLQSSGSRQPYREVWRAVIVIVEFRERLAVSREPGRLAVRDPVVISTSSPPPAWRRPA